MASMRIRVAREKRVVPLRMACRSFGRAQRLDHGIGTGHSRRHTGLVERIAGEFFQCRRIERDGGRAARKGAYAVACIQGALHRLEADAVACADDENCGHGRLRPTAPS
jgi:hypothetical protein